MTEPQTPTTEAGRTLLATYGPGGVPMDPDEMAEHIIAIEAEAAATERRRVLAEVLRGLESEEQTTQVRAIIAQVQTMLAEADHE